MRFAVEYNRQERELAARCAAAGLHYEPLLLPISPALAQRF